MKVHLVQKFKMLILACLSFGLLFPLTAFAETDVTDLVEIQKSRLRYDRRAGTSSTNVSIKNLSGEVLLTPIKVVIDSISGTDVTVSNADGTTDDGKPYFEYDTDKGQFLASEETEGKTWYFDNSNRARFSYTTVIYATVPEAAVDIGVEGGEIEITEAESAIYGAKIEVPKGAVDLDVVISVSSTNSSDTPANYMLAGSPINLGPDGLTFSEDVIVTIPYNDVDNDGIIDGTSISELEIIFLHSSDVSASWEEVPIIYQDTDLNFIQAKISHFSIVQAAVAEQKIKAVWLYSSLLLNKIKFDKNSTDKAIEKVVSTL